MAQHVTFCIQTIEPKKEPFLLAIIQAAGWPIWLLLIASVIGLALIIRAAAVTATPAQRMITTCPTKRQDAVTMLIRQAGKFLFKLAYQGIDVLPAGVDYHVGHFAIQRVALGVQLAQARLGVGCLQ